MSGARLELTGAESTIFVEPGARGLSNVGIRSAWGSPGAGKVPTGKPNSSYWTRKCTNKSAGTFSRPAVRRGRSPQTPLGSLLKENPGVIPLFR